MLTIVVWIFICTLVIITLCEYNIPILIPFIFIFLLIPGRVQGYYYKNQFRGRKLLDRKNYKESIKYNKIFLEDIRQNTWKKKLIHLSGAVYSKDIEAMTLNNLGSAYLELGNLKSAETCFQQAIKLDLLYPIPYFNLSLVECIKGNIELAEIFYQKSVELGFKQTTFDKLIQKGQQIYAEIEG
ncbi:tetratricopeptide repeat protein [Romboutsia lituseburensis]|uniref:tetratricopeptide repeat protein n=1 Tax=Romboutsia lituseburensis TaxID=1537 RepID=UPI00215B4269|nr:tetratricopeptide repeat protein [Romboutsia lituseburensis]MCR8745858.1 tetratricopeptide repeat protein [Romboutsia lituseburensis]